MNQSKPGAERRALERILSTPNPAQLVAQLQPEALHRVIQTCGLEDCGDLLALTTPEQIRQLCDLDLWRPERPGRNETFDAARFGIWLEVLVDAGPSVAAQKLSELDPDMVTAGLAEHVRVFDRAASAEYVTTDGEVIQGCRLPGDRLTADVGGYVLVARRAGAWDAIIAVLSSLETEQPRCFLDVMSGVRALSNSTPEIDGLDDLLTDGDQLMYDVGSDRDQRREGQGYVAVSDARAFLQEARKSRFEAGLRLRSGQDPKRAPLLPDFGLQPRRPRLMWIRDQMQYLAHRDPDAYAARNGDLAYLANTLIAGCPLQGRAFSPQEAGDAVAAVCNLGLERLSAPVGFLASHELTSAFEAGWTVLHDDVVMYAADQLTRVLADLHCRDRAIQADLATLRNELVKHLRSGTPWLARPKMDVLASFDMPAWAVLLGLVDECPVLHAAIAAARDRTTHAVSASAFEFISENAMILDVRAFMQSLPAALASPRIDGIT